MTIFTAGAQETLPIWIFANLFRPIEQPVVNVWIAQRMTVESGLTRRR